MNLAELDDWSRRRLLWRLLTDRHGLRQPCPIHTTQDCKPRADQIAPNNGNYATWAIIAGRGYGKTRAAAEEFAEQLRRSPVAARAAVVAPTFAAGRDICIEGRSGLLSVLPPSALKGGSTATAWNRSIGELRLEAGHYVRLFSSEKPGLIRGPEHCVTGDTLVTMADGSDRPIVNVRAGDAVQTRKGPRRVLKRWDNGHRDAYEVRLSDGRTLVTTGSHRLATPTGWVQTLDATPGSTVLTWQNSEQSFNARSAEARLSSEAATRSSVALNALRTTTSRMSANGTSSEPVSVGRTGSLPKTAGPATLTAHSPPNLSTRSSKTTGPCGRSTTDPHHRGTTSITSTTTATTTGSRTSKPSQLSSTNLTTRRATTRTSVGETPSSRRQACARSAGPTGQSDRWDQHVAPIAAATVVSVQPVGTRHVYDLTVEGEHEYVANGIVVHNSLAWLEEVATLSDSAAKPDTPDTTWSNTRFGLRLPPARMIVTGTPKPKALVRYIVDRCAESPSWYLTNGSTYDNLANLADEFREEILGRYEGTRLAKQELLGLLLEEAEFALWHRPMFEADDFYHVLDVAERVRVVVGVDPSGTETGDECGIVTCASYRPVLPDPTFRGDPTGETSNQRDCLHVLADDSLRGSPQQWARRVVDVYHREQADYVAVEKNYGGDMAMTVIQQVDGRVPVKNVNATRGKRVRAEPVAAIYEQCVTGDTQILTPRGEVPITAISPTDKVMTSGGWRRVLWAGETGEAKPVLRIATQGSAIYCTPNHPVYVVGHGFVPAHDVRAGDKLLIWRPLSSRALTVPPTCGSPADDACRALRPSAGRLGRLSDRSLCSTALASTSRQTATTERRTSGETTPTGPTLCSIGLCGNQCTARYPQASTFTTLTMTGRTTTRRTSRLSPRATTPNIITPQRWAGSWRTPTSTRSEAKPHDGPRSLGRSSTSTATGAAKCSPNATPHHGSAPRLVTPPTGILLAESVASVSPAGTANVWNLMVEETPEFVANGILVHNCRASHQQPFDILEEELVTTEFTSGEKSPNRLDALVWAATELLLGGAQTAQSNAGLLTGG